MLTNSGRLKAAKEDWVVVEEFESKPEWGVVGLVGAHVANLEAHLAQVEAERIVTVYYYTLGWLLTSIAVVDPHWTWSYTYGCIQ